MKKLNGLNNKGFTLIELLMVILILAILALMAITQFANYTKDARDATVKSNLQMLRRGIQTQYGQMRLRCNVRNDDWPEIAALSANNITSGTHCDTTMVPEVSNQVFINNAIPANPWQINSSTVIDGTSISGTAARALCDSSAGWCYNEDTGDIWANSQNNDGNTTNTGDEINF